MKKAFAVLSLATVVGSMAFAQEQTLSCDEGSEQVVSCTTTENPEEVMADEVLVCQDEAGQYSLQLSGQGLPSPSMNVKSTPRTGATTFTGEEQDVFVELVVSSAPLRQDGKVYRAARLTLALPQGVAKTKMKCLR